MFTSVCVFILFFVFLAPTVSHSLPLSSVSLSMGITFFSYWLGIFCLVFSNFCSRRSIYLRIFIFSVIRLSRPLRSLPFPFLCFISCWRRPRICFTSLMFLSVVSCNFCSNPLSRLQILQLQFRSLSSLVLIPRDLLFLLVGVWSLFAMWSLEWTSSQGCCFP